MRLERNPYFRVWSPLARPDGYPDVIEAAFGVGAGEAVDGDPRRPQRLRVGRPLGENMADVRERDPACSAKRRSCSPRGCS